MTTILGSGIIGVSTAYYLSSHPSYDPKTTPITLIEATSQPFQSASGYAGGFLAKDWFSPALAELGALSFDLHRKVAEENEGRKKWGYSSSTALSLGIEQTDGKKVRGEDWLLDGTSRREVATGVGLAGRRGKGTLLQDDGSPAWVTPQEGGTMEVIGTPDGCAQVEPYLLCSWLLEQCIGRGVKVLLGSKATGLKRDAEGRFEKLLIQEIDTEKETELQCTNILIAAGAWTPRVFKTLFPHSKLSIPIEPLAGHSIVVRSPRHTLAHDEAYGSAHAVFCAPSKHWKIAPEAVSRTGRDGQTEIYIAGLNSSTLPLPELASGAKTDESAIKELRGVMVQFSGLSREGVDVHEDDLEVVREGLCFRPVAPGGKPILCRMEDEELEEGMVGGGGVFIAAGHGPWGICLSLGTGMVMSQLMLGEKTSARIDRLRMR